MLKIREINTRAEFNHVLENTRNWEIVAQREMKGSSLSRKRSLEDCALVASMITPFICNSIESGHGKMVVCEADSMRSIAFFGQEGKTIKIHTMVTNPLNLRSGAGKALTYYLFQECIKDGKEEVVAIVRPLSILFYKKLGFEEGYRFSAEVGGEMRITSEKIQEIMKSFR